MLKYFSQHLTKFFMSRDSFAKTTVTPKDPSSKIFNYFQNIIIIYKKYFINTYITLNFKFKLKLNIGCITINTSLHA